MRIRLRHRHTPGFAAYSKINAWSCGACATRCSRTARLQAGGGQRDRAQHDREDGMTVSAVSGGARLAGRAPSGSVVDRLEQIALNAWVLRLAEPEDRLLSQLGPFRCGRSPSACRAPQDRGSVKAKIGPSSRDRSCDRTVPRDAVCSPRRSGSQKAPACDSALPAGRARCSSGSPRSPTRCCCAIEKITFSPAHPVDAAVDVAQERACWPPDWASQKMACARSSSLTSLRIT